MSSDLQRFLEHDSSKINMESTAGFVLAHPKEFSRLMEIATGNGKAVSMRAATVVERICRTKADWICPYFSQIISGLPNFTHPGQKRNFLKIFTRITPGEEELGLLLEYCFKAMLDQKETIAVQAYAMEIIFNALDRYPELSHEFRLMLTRGMPHGSPGWKARAKKYLKKLPVD